MLRAAIEERAAKEFPGLAEAIRNDRIDIQVHQFSQYTLEEQVRMAANAAVFVTTAGGGATPWRDVM